LIAPGDASRSQETAEIIGERMKLDMEMDGVGFYEMSYSKMTSMMLMNRNTIRRTGAMTWHL
jgi:hypothetical protein